MKRFKLTDEDGEINIDRKPEQVFAPETLASFENKPITCEHPSVDVNPSNYKEYAVGFVRDVHQGKVDGQDVILGDLVITDAQVIEDIENNERTDLSCGYDCDLSDEANPQQMNIRGNHVALCEQGRAGNARIVDSAIKDDVMLKDLSNSSIKDSGDYIYLTANEKLDNDTISKKYKQRYSRLPTIESIEEDGHNYINHENIFIVREPSGYFFRVVQAMKNAVIKDTDYVIYKEGNIWYGTPKENYDARIRNANRISSFKTFTSAQQIIDYLKKYSNKNINFIVKDSAKDDGNTMSYRGYNIISRDGYYFVEKDGQEYGWKTLDDRVLAFGKAVEAKNAIRWNHLAKFNDAVKDNYITDRPEGAFKQISNALSSYVPTKLVVLGHGWKWKVSTTPQEIVADFADNDEEYGNDPADMSRISANDLKQDLQNYLQSKMQQHVVTVKSASFIKTSHGGIAGVRFRIGTKLKHDSLDNAIQIAKSKCFNVDLIASDAILIKASNFNDVIKDEDEWKYILNSDKKNTYNEYTVEAYKNGSRYKNADYMTDDKDDAINTISAMADRQNLTLTQSGKLYIADNAINIVDVLDKARKMK